MAAKDPMLHSEARTEVGQLLDDASNIRWTPAQVDAALKTQINVCMGEYVYDGGDRFDEEVTGTTSGSANSLSLATYDPMEVRGVTVKIGSAYVPLRKRKRRDRGAVDSTARELYCLIVRTPSFPTAPTDELVSSDGTTAMNTWPGFDSWVCAEAALQLAVKDAELTKALGRHAGRLRDTVVTKGPASASVQFPRGRSYGGLDWVWNPLTQEIEMVRSSLWPLFEVS